MGTVADVLRVLESCGAILGLVLYWFVLRRDYETDLFRNRLFAIRNELFDFASSGQVGFDHSAYTDLRSSVNGLIRYAHRFTFWQVMRLLINRTAQQKFTAKWEKSLQSITDPETREALQRYRITLGLLLIGHLVRTSIWTMSLLAPVWIWAQFRRLFRSTASQPIAYFENYSLAMKANEAETVLTVRRHLPAATDIEEELLASAR